MSYLIQGNGGRLILRKDHDGFLLIKTPDVSIINSIVTQHILMTVSPGSFGMGIIFKQASESFVEGTTNVRREAVANTDWKDALKNLNVRSTRYPGAGHNTVPAWHWDMPHTVVGPDFTAKNNSDGTTYNPWDPNYRIYLDLFLAGTPDPLYTPGPRTEVTTAEAWAHACRDLNMTGVLICGWRSPELWRVIGGNFHYYVRPNPLDIDDNPIAESSPLTKHREDQKLETRRLLKKLFAEGMPEPLWVQLTEEYWSGWDDGYKPWIDDPSVSPDYDPNNGDSYNGNLFVARTIPEYFADMATYAASIGKQLKFSSQFRDSFRGGRTLMSSKQCALLIRKLNDLITQGVGLYLSGLAASIHYRRTWNQWLAEGAMTFSFMSNSTRFITLAEMKTWMDAFVAERGFPNIQFFPNSNSVGDVADDEVVVPTKPQLALMGAQYALEGALAGFPFVFPYPGQGGDNDAITQKNGITEALGSMTSNLVYTRHPLWYATKLVSDAIAASAARMVSINVDDSAIVPFACIYGTDHLRLWFFNKGPGVKSQSLTTDCNLVSVSGSWRASETELNAPTVNVISNLKVQSLTIALSPLSMTVVDLVIDQSGNRSGGDGKDRFWKAVLADRIRRGENGPR